MVPLPDAGFQPRAVVVVLANTLPTILTVLGSHWLLIKEAERTSGSVSFIFTLFMQGRRQ